MSIRQHGLALLALLRELARHQHCCDLHLSKLPYLMPSHTIIDKSRPDFNVLVADLIRDLDLETDLAKAVLPVILQNLQVLDRKQQDYGSANLTKFGSFGVTVRMNDKLERIINLTKRRQFIKDVQAPNSSAVPLNESLSDSYLDLANYALIAYVMEQNLWPKP